MKPASSAHIGYSACDTSEQSYEYIEDSCFIADRPETLRAFTENCWQPSEVYRAEAVTLADIERDFGVSGGRYMMEGAALKRFRQSAEAGDLVYAVVEEDKTWGASGLFGIEVNCHAS